MVDVTGPLRISIVSRQAPVAEGTAPGRILLGFCDGLQALGHAVSVWYWGPERPHGELPSWCEWRPLPPESAVRMRARALMRPRSDIVRARWQPPDGHVVIADDVPSFPAVANTDRPVLQVHYATRLEMAALARHELRDMQDVRAERRFVRMAAVPLAYSERVSATLGGRPVPVPAALRIPERLPIVEEPVALMIADWRWPPNVAALRRLLGVWDGVRAKVPHARLLLAGRGVAPVGRGDGVEVVGEVRHTADVLSRAAVLAFPCPPTSGPKIKVMDALASGIPVVTTPAGIEGIEVPPDAATVVDELGFGDALARVLADPEIRAKQAEAARAGMIATHAPMPAAARRLEVMTPVLS